MEQEQIDQLKDMQAFIQLGIESDLRFFMIIGTLIHDINGIIKDEEGFLPRTSGCAKNLEKLNSLPHDKNNMLSTVRSTDMGSGKRPQTP